MDPSRNTLGLVPPGSYAGLLLLLLPFALAFALGLHRRLRGLGVARLIAASEGGWPGAARRLLRYALLQRRVARRRRGWPHLAVFAGFVVLLLGTSLVALDWDILRPLGWRLLRGRPYLWLEALLDGMGLVFVAGLAAAIVWRLRRWGSTGPEQRPVQRQFLLLLLALLYLGVTGFVLESLRLAIEPTPWGHWSFAGQALAQALALTDLDAARRVYIGLWWSHATVAFTLIALLPYSTFLHALAAPLNLMVHPGRPRLELETPFDLRELLASGNFEVKAGAGCLDDFGAAERLALLACTNCARCDEVCPAHAAGTALAPRRLVQSLRARLLAADGASDLLAPDIAAAAWACTTCGACVQACPVFIRPVDYIVPLRRELMTRQMLDPRQTEFLGKLALGFNPYGFAPASRARLADELRQGGAGA